MKVLVGFSRCAHTRAAFETQGFEVWTCDLLPCDHPRHYQGDVFDIIDGNWVMGVFHPMCTYVNVASAWALKDPDFERYPGVGYHQRVKPGTLTGEARRKARDDAIELFIALDELPYPRVIENPAPSQISKRYRPPDQIVQPYQFGDDASKRTGLWITGLPTLQPTEYVEPRIVNGRPRWGNQTNSGQNRLTPGDDRWIERSKTYPGIARAIGTQMGGYIMGLTKEELT